MKLKEKIVETTIDLFNKNGCQPITTNHIIDELGISPGTFYYHFKNKEEIIRTVFAAIVLEFDRTVELELTDLSVDKIVFHIEGIYTLYYKYRFFYIDIAMLLKRDKELRHMYMENLNLKQKKLTALFEILIESGFIVKIGPGEELERLLHNMWMINDFWFSYLTAQQKPISTESIKEGVVQCLYLLKPYIGAEIQVEYIRTVNQYSKE